MEVFSILFGIVFWPAAIIAWFFYLYRRKPAKWMRVVGTLLVVGLPLIAAISMGKYMFLDEPLSQAAWEGDIAQVKSLLAHGADPNARLKTGAALTGAASQGHTDIVRLLLAHGARTDIQSDIDIGTALQAAQKGGHPDVVRVLKQAGATR